MCRKVAEPLERIAGSASAEEPTVMLMREELENLLRANHGVGIKICSHLPGFDPQESDVPGSRDWFNQLIVLTRKELDNICGGNGGYHLEDYEWDELLSDNPYSSRHGSGGWIRVDNETLDTLLKVNGGEGVSHKYSMNLYYVRFDYNESAPISRTTLDHLLDLQGSSMTSDAQWNMIMTTFYNDMSRPTPKLTDFDWYAYDKIMSPSRREDEAVTPKPDPKSLTMTRQQVAHLLERLGSPATVQEFFNEEDWMEQTLVTTTTLDELNLRLEYLNTLHPTAQMGLLTVADFHSVRTRCAPPAEPERFSITREQIERLPVIEWIQHDSRSHVILNPEEEEYWDV